VLAAERFSTAAPDRERYGLLAEKVRTQLSEKDQVPTLEAVVGELGSAMATMTAAKERHQATGAVLQAALDDTEAANPEEVAAAIMALQTRLQASYQTTSILSRLFDGELSVAAAIARVFASRECRSVWARSLWPRAPGTERGARDAVGSGRRRTPAWKGGKGSGPPSGRRDPRPAPRRWVLGLALRSPGCKKPSRP
jgi:hypothetical protein